MTRAVLGLCVLAGALLDSEAVYAQPGADSGIQLERIEAAYAGLEYAEAEALARTALSRFEAFSPDQLVRIHTTLALILYARGEEREAGDQFRAALSLNPELVLDPLLVSPVTLAFFEELKDERERAQTRDPDGEPLIRYIQVADPRPGATWRSVVLPGWGQHYKGEAVKGWAVAGLWATTLAVGTVAHARYRQEDDVYRGLQGAEAEAYWEDNVRTWYKVRGWALAGTAAVWVYAASDALLTGGPRLGTGPVVVAPGPGGVYLRYRF